MDTYHWGRLKCFRLPNGIFTPLDCICTRGTGTGTGTDAEKNGWSTESECGWKWARMQSSR
ncbi:predicted protein [Sclerotinia sclerotiorum 1980 UF-70]|uniref:Uncharacterized protein n=1 Tax=Sclerotinia sclerotiorum (strain ATCC 18683 / 1980 / Ss-1) TaxID=665079 RepID=A7EKV3_SCLS1|nr:predicted protein [Sclerotinia sclerotiorum 1980 UF-70]EDO03469.1 predicted protein [Sclerotinia sclerotiorum 1980 UF-70]